MNKNINRAASLLGKKGGQALYARVGSEGMRLIGKNGATKKWAIKRAQEAEEAKKKDSE